ncbi:hypothetical protein LSH36_64g02014 [Paralvinella palmiformis]|uniref:Cadherin domain-containing protein n=1 Tax=Paralvinella palmiformis TaxID=53620 RepID=A0AAD9K469_9ANNE|nr:hypothetical protein LSH36_64g02014 [Paralvinella palmiformis]
MEPISGFITLKNDVLRRGEEFTLLVQTTSMLNRGPTYLPGDEYGYSVVIVNLVNVNTHNPEFERSIYHFQGHKEPDFFIGKVHAVDLDIGSTVTYSLIQNNSAEDDASPPRKDAAVAMVKFGVGVATTMTTQTDLVIIIILAVLSGCLLLIIIVLSIYIYRNQNSPPTITHPYGTEAEHIDAYFETSKSFERGINDIPTDYHNSYIDTSAGVYKPTARDRHLAIYNDVGTGRDSTAIQENPFQTRVKGTHGSKEGKNSYSGYSAQSVNFPGNSRPDSRSSHPGSHSSRSHPHSSQSVARSEPRSSDYGAPRHASHMDYETALSPMDDELYSTLSTSDPSFRNSAGSLNMFKVGNSTQALVPPHSPAGSGMFKGKGSSVSFIDDHQVNVYQPDNAISHRDKPEITVYY